jgi:hypothetical protein
LICDKFALATSDIYSTLLLSGQRTMVGRKLQRVSHSQLLLKREIVQHAGAKLCGKLQELERETQAYYL